MLIYQLFHPAAVRVPLEATDKKSAINSVIDAIAAAHDLPDVEGVRAAVWEREMQRSTGMGDGLAIPHARSETAAKFLLGIGSLAQPIDFDAIDRKPVHMVIVVVSPAEKRGEHIQVLGKISRLMSRIDFREAAYAAEDAASLMKLFEDAEKAAAAQA
ncbi:MAG: PTS sugar transporter subunit IIA [Phycisphaerales bacterium]